MNKQEALAELAALKERADALEKIINAPEPAPSLLTKPEPGGGKRYYTICGRARRRTGVDSYQANCPEREWYRQGNIFTDSKIADAYADAIETLLLLRHQPGTVAPASCIEQFVIEPKKHGTAPRVCSWRDIDTKAARISPCFITPEAAHAALDAVGADRIERMWKTLHHIS